MTLDFIGVSEGRVYIFVQNLYNFVHFGTYFSMLMSVKCCFI